MERRQQQQQHTWNWSPAEKESRRNAVTIGRTGRCDARDFDGHRFAIHFASTEIRHDILRHHQSCGTAVGHCLCCQKFGVRARSNTKSSLLPRPISETIDRIVLLNERFAHTFFSCLFKHREHNTGVLFIRRSYGSDKFQKNF